MSRLIDLRSDTVTLPTREMLDAMYRAELGDDGYSEDATVNRLEELAAARIGKERALFVPSGTMGNLLALLTHCPRGSEAIMGDKAHILLWEGAGASTLGGIQIRTVPNLKHGEMPTAAVKQAIRQEPFPPRTALVCLENTHNRCGGTVVKPTHQQEIATLAHDAGIPIHLDGSRIFHAAMALGVEPQLLTREMDSVMFCLSKGLAAPVGSVLCGTADFIREARQLRMVVGGQMRQAGVLAAAGIVALETMVARLREDHANARDLADQLAQMPELEVFTDLVETNIVMFRLRQGDVTVNDFLNALALQGVKMGAIEGDLIRAVTHYGIERQDVHTTIAIARDTLNAMIAVQV